MVVTVPPSTHVPVPDPDGPRVGVLTWDQAVDRSSFSGMPWNMRRGLEGAGCHVLPISVDSSGMTGISGRGWSGGARSLRRRGGRFLRNRGEDLFSGVVRRRADRRARVAARSAEEACDRAGVDVVFGPCMSRALAFFGGRWPVVYASDATASLLIGTYEQFARRGRGWREATILHETRALARAERIALASGRARQSAIQDHGADPNRVEVVPMGANVRPVSEDTPSTPRPPTPEDLRLLLSAADPERKRLGLCLEIVRELRRREWRATLHYIGPYRPACDAPEVAWAGRLSLADPADARVHRALLRESHLAILPSLAEMFGIAPIESAAYGRPAVVSDAGGLPTVVRDGITGRVVPRATSPVGWADAVEAMISRPERYADFCIAARDRYQRTLNWDAWGRTVRSLIEQVI